MSINTEQLKEIEKYSNEKIKEVKLSQGWEEGDINSNVDFDLKFRDGKELSVMIVTISMIDKFIKDDGLYVFKSSVGYEWDAVVNEMNVDSIKKVLDSLR